MLLDIVKVLIYRVWSFKLTAYLWPSPSRMFAVSSILLRSLVFVHPLLNCAGRAKLAQIQQEEAKQQRIQAFAKKLRVCTSALVFAERAIRASAPRHPASKLSLAQAQADAAAEHEETTVTACPIMAREPAE